METFFFLFLSENCTCLDCVGKFTREWDASFCLLLFLTLVQEIIEGRLAQISTEQVEKRILVLVPGTQQQRIVCYDCNDSMSWIVIAEMHIVEILRTAEVLALPCLTAAVGILFVH